MSKKPNKSLTVPDGKDLKPTPSAEELHIAKIPQQKEGVEIIDGIEIDIDAKIKEMNIRLKKLKAE